MPNVPGGGLFAGAAVQPVAALGADVDADGHLGGEAGLDLDGPAALRGRYGWAPVDRTTTAVGNSRGGADHSVEVLGTLRLPVEGFSLCPAAGGEMTLAHRTDRDLRETWRLPIGVGVARQFELGSSARVAPFLFPRAVLASSPRKSLAETSTGTRVTESRSERMGGRLDVGAVLSVGGWYGTTSFRIRSDFNGSLDLTRVFDLTVGVRF